MATYAIGDIHGCYDQLIQLLELIKFDQQKDTLWFTGDLVNGGPKPAATIRFIKSQKPDTVCILGNHDITLLAAAAGKIPLPNDRGIGVEEIINAPDREELLEWVRYRPLTHYSEQFNTLLVHAGILPNWDLTTVQTLAYEVENILQSNDPNELYANLRGDLPNTWDPNLQGWERIRFIINVFTRMRFCNASGSIDLSSKGEITTAPVGYQAWFQITNQYFKDKKIIFGHWAALMGKTDIANIYAIDTGCVWGNSLTALRLDDWQRFAVENNK
jgi:bis(5'-nucleosyl)-tetraphosphatase (symmetrical)